MNDVPILEDPSYAGRGGGYIARITGKLLQECATSQRHQLFLAAPCVSPPHFVFAGVNQEAPAIYRVPEEYYAAVYGRLHAICCEKSNVISGERVLSYSGHSFTLRLELVATPPGGIKLSFSPNA